MPPSAPGRLTASRRLSQKACGRGRSHKRRWTNGDRCAPRRRGLAGLSVATACGAEPRVPQVPPAELARQALETVAEKLPRELVENDLLKKIARSWASLAPAHRLGLVIEDASGCLAFLLLSSGVCCVLLTMVSLSPLGFALGLVAPFAVGAARDGFESRREQHDAEEAMPEAFTALSMSLASTFAGPGHALCGRSCARASAYRVFAGGGGDRLRHLGDRRAR